MMSMVRKLKGLFKRNQDDRVTPLPKKILSITFGFLLINGMLLTTVFSYLPQMIKWFGTPEVDTGFYAGILASTLYIDRIVFSFIWGYVVDVRGHKVAIVGSSVCVIVTTLAFGFSTTFYWALVTRMLQGGAMGLTLIAKSLLCQHCDNTNLALAMSILFSAFSLGLLIGPSLAGFLVFPTESYPDVFSKGGFFETYAIMLPNLIIVVICCILLVIGLFVLPNDKRVEEEKRYLLSTNHLPKSYVESEDNTSDQCNTPETYTNISTGGLTDIYNGKCVHHFQIIEPILSFTQGQEKLSFHERLKDSKIGQVFRNKWCVVISILYGVYALMGIGYDEMFPLYTATSTLYNGIGFSPADIGLALLICSGFLIIIQIVVLPKLIKILGSKKVFFLCVSIYGIILPLLPTIAEIENKKLMWVILSLHLLTCRSVIAGGFLTINILLNNSVDGSLRGSANGLGMGFSSIGRAVAPGMFGSIFSWSLTNIKGVQGNDNALGFPLNQYLTFFVMSLIAGINIIIAYQIPESLNKEMANADETEGDSVSLEDHRVTNIIVSSFTPQIIINNSDVV